MLNQLYEKFRYWSENGSVYIYSDPHFGDSDCKFMDAEWPFPLQQVNKINSKAKKNDTLIILGDIGDVSYIKKLKAGYKILIAGNHDAGMANYKDYFDEVYEGPLFISDKILLSHEPIDLPFVLNIHGHRHDLEGGLRDKNHYNVCSNTINYTPINLKDIILSGALKQIDDIHRVNINDAIERKFDKK